LTINGVDIRLNRDFYQTNSLIKPKKSWCLDKISRKTNDSGNRTFTYHIVLRIAFAEDIWQSWRISLWKYANKFDANSMLKHINI